MHSLTSTPNEWYMYTPRSLNSAIQFYYPAPAFDVIARRQGGQRYTIESMSWFASCLINSYFIIQNHPLPTHIHTGGHFPARKNTELRVNTRRSATPATAGRNAAAPNIQTSPGGCATLAGGTDVCAYFECLHVCPCTCVVSVLVFVTVTFPSPSAQSSLFRVNHVVLYSQPVVLFAVKLLLPATACYYRNKVVLYKSKRRIVWSLQSLLQCTTTSFDTSLLQVARSWHHCYHLAYSLVKTLPILLVCHIYSPPCSMQKQPYDFVGLLCIKEIWPFMEYRTCRKCNWLLCVTGKWFYTCLSKTDEIPHLYRWSFVYFAADR